MTADEIFIRSGATLTITNGAVLTMTQSPNGNGVPTTCGCIDIEATPATQNISGGRLVVDNATITGAFQGSWNGIYVWGNNDPYYISSPYLSQTDFRVAKATFKNAIIKNSQKGVANAQENPLEGRLSPYASGGIINAVNTQFLNNTISVRMVSYQNFIDLGTSKFNLPDYSYFNLCKFDFNITPTSTNNINFYGFISLEGVDGMKFLGNEYTTGIYNSGTYNPYTVINTYNSGFIIDNYCAAQQPYKVYGQPCAATSSVFTNYGRANSGIYVSSFNAQKVIQIKNATFNNVTSGMSLFAASRAMVLNNRINLGPEDSSVGIFLGGCLGSEVEDNVIQLSNTVYNRKTWGIAVKNSKGGNNSIYRNNTVNMQQALQSLGDNRNSTTNVDGLRFRCNNMSNAAPNAYDITVVNAAPNSYTPPPTLFGISTLQANLVNGAATLSVAGNTFSALDNFVTPRNFVNNGVSLTYVGSIPANGSYNVTQVSGQPYSCPSNYGTPAKFDPVAFPTKKSNLEIAINSGTAGKDALLAEYATLHNQALDYYNGYWADTAYVNTDSLIWVLDNAQYFLDFKLRKAGLEAGIHRWADAQTTLATIPSQFTLTPEEQQDINNLAYIYNVAETFENNGHNWDSLSASDQQGMIDLANNGSGYSRFACRAMVAMGTGAVFPPEVVEINDGSFERSEGGDIKNSARLSSNKNEVPFQVFPNPAKDGVVRIVGSMLEGGSYTLADGLGRVALSGKISGSETILNVSSLSAGIYILKVIEVAGETHTAKITRN